MDWFQIIRGEEPPPEEEEVKEEKPKATILFCDKEIECKIFGVSSYTGPAGIIVSLNVSFSCSWNSIQINNQLGKMVQLNVPQKDLTFAVKKMFVTNVEFQDRLDGMLDITLTGTLNG